MENRKPMSVEAAWAALRGLADELAATHAAPFTVAFFEEHQEGIERAFQSLIEGVPNERELSNIGCGTRLQPAQNVELRTTVY